MFVWFNKHLLNDCVSGACGQVRVTRVLFLTRGARSRVGDRAYKNKMGCKEAVGESAADWPTAAWVQGHGRAGLQTKESDRGWMARAWGTGSGGQDFILYAAGASKHLEQRSNTIQAAFRSGVQSANCITDYRMCSHFTSEVE